MPLPSKIILKPRSPGLSTLIRDITAAAVTGVADAIHAGGPGSGRRCEICSINTKGTLCPKCNEAVEKYSDHHGIGKADALDDLQKAYAKGGDSILRRYATSYQGDLADTIRMSVKNVKAGGPGSGRHPSGLSNEKLDEKVRSVKHINKVLENLGHEERVGYKPGSGHVFWYGGKADGFYESGLGIARPSHLSVRGFLDDLDYRLKNDQNVGTEYAANLKKRYGFQAAGEATYPSNHKAGMAVPKGGSSCASCKYLADNKVDCRNTYFQKWNGGPKIPGKIDEYCSDWYMHGDVDAGAATDNPNGWHGVDLDGTIAHYTTFKGPDIIGTPIKGEALARVKTWLKKGERVKIFTARAGDPKAVKAIKKWSKQVFGQVLEVTDKKDPDMIDSLDDSIHHVKRNTGEIVAGGPGSGRHPNWQTGTPKNWNEKDYKRLVSDTPTLKLSNINAWQKFRNNKVVQQYVEKLKSGEPVRAISVSKHENGNDVSYRIENGHHRYWAAKKLGLSEIPVTVERSGRELMEYDEANPDMAAASEQSFGVQHKGTKWNNIILHGFTGPEEEVLRAALSRIPPELLTYVKCIVSAKELNARHGMYIPASQTVKFNPQNLLLKQHFGGGENPISHADLAMVHEIGHSLFDNLSPEEQKDWLAISGWMKGTKAGQAPPYEETRPGWDHIISKWTHKVGAKFPRYYAEKNPNEDFADCFSFFLQNKANRIGDDKTKFFEHYMKEHVHNYPVVSIKSPVS